MLQHTLIISFKFGEGIPLVSHGGGASFYIDADDREFDSQCLLHLAWRLTNNVSAVSDDVNSMKARRAGTNAGSELSKKLVQALDAQTSTRSPISLRIFSPEIAATKRGRTNIRPTGNEPIAVLAPPCA